MRMMQLVLRTQTGLKIIFQLLKRILYRLFAISSTIFSEKVIFMMARERENIMRE
ncbi:hypothetical protein D3C76_1469740 [compost metagenome]